MNDTQQDNSSFEQLASLKAKYDKIKSETEDFLADAKHLSEIGIHDAKEILESAKSHWQSIVSSFGGKVFTKAKSKKKTAPSKAKKPSKSQAKKKKTKKRK